MPDRTFFHITLPESPFLPATVLWAPKRAIRCRILGHSWLILASDVRACTRCGLQLKFHHVFMSLSTKTVHEFGKEQQP